MLLLLQLKLLLLLLMLALLLKLDLLLEGLERSWVGLERITLLPTLSEPLLLEVREVRRPEGGELVGRRWGGPRRFVVAVDDGKALMGSYDRPEVLIRNLV